MKKFFSFLCAALVVLSASAGVRSNGPVQLGKSDAKASVAPKFNKVIRLDGSKSLRAAAPARAAKDALPAFDATLTISNITATSADYAIAPVDANLPYMLSYIEADVFATLTEDDIAAEMQSQLDYYIAMYAMLGMSLTYDDFVTYGADNDSFEDLSPETDYVVLAYVLDLTTGLAASQFVTANFTTGSVAPVADFVGTITVSNITGTGATIDVAATSMGTYYWDIFSKEDYDKAVAGQLAGYGIADAAGLIQYALDDMLQDYSLSQIVVSGNDSWTYSSLTPETEFVVLAVAVDAAGQVSGPVTVELFTTEAVQTSDNVITITYDANAQAVNFNASNNDPYFVWVELKSEYDAYYTDLTDASLLGEMEDWIAAIEYYGASVDAYIMQGNQVSPMTEWVKTVEEGEYIAMAAPYAGVFNGAPAYCVFTISQGTALKNAEAPVKAQKMLENGQIVILKNGAKFNAQGAKL